MKLLLGRGHNWCLVTTGMVSLVVRMEYWGTCWVADRAYKHLDNCTLRCRELYKASGRRTVDRVMLLVVLHTLELWAISHQGMSFSPAEK